MPADKVLPFMPPGATCNARLHRGAGYCSLPAGQGTRHPGVGRCRLHGGDSGGRQDHPDGVIGQYRALGLGVILDLAETMTQDDQEYLMTVGNNALVVARAKVLARLQDPDTSAKELADLTMALQRIDAILLRHPDEDDPDAAPNTPDWEERREMERLLALEREFGS